MVLTQSAFARLSTLFLRASGIQLVPSKKSLVMARLSKRVEALALADFDAYCDYLARPENADERTRAVDLLTTNETYFFREPSHFQYLAGEVRARAGQPLRVWSAACSSGEEPYSLAMTILEQRPTGEFEILASDLSSRVLAHASAGVYPMSRLEQMPPTYLKRFCLRGRDQFEGTLRVAPTVRRKVAFFQHNLMDSARRLGKFDVIFLRNVLIYFDPPTKIRVVQTLIDRLAPKGLLFVGQAEGLHSVAPELARVDRSVYQRRDG